MFFITVFTCPMLTVSTSAGATFPALKASLAAAAIRSEGWMSRRRPPILPKGVRFAATMKIPADIINISRLLQAVACCSEPKWVTGTAPGPDNAVGPGFIFFTTVSDLDQFSHGSLSCSQSGTLLCNRGESDNCIPLAPT